jgi:5-methylcytosine-specific restriction endonuclease McrA
MPCACGCGKEGYIWARGYLKGHEPVKPKPIRKITSKQREKIKENKDFYAEFIARHKTKCCDECEEPIKRPTGSNVSHIIPGQANPALYHDYRNAFLLCQTCENQWTRVSPKTMKIWPEAQRRRTELLREHYVQPLIKKK